MKRNWNRMICALLLAALVLTTVPSTAAAAEGYGVEVLPDIGLAYLGEKVTLTFRLTGYDSAMAGIQGFQLDVENESNLLQTASWESRVTDTENLAANNIWYSTEKDKVSFLYAKNIGSVLDTTQEELMTLTVAIPEDLTGEGTFTLPVTLYIYTEDDQELTCRTEAAISYTATMIYDVDIAWGELSYTYTDGSWDVNTHTYANGFWKVDSQDGNKITVTNHGRRSVTAELKYLTDRTDIQGSFDKTLLTLASGGYDSAVLTLSGKPSEDLENEVIGSVTITLG